MPTIKLSKESAGDALRRKVLADLDEVEIDLDSREAEALERACLMADRIAELEGLIAEHGRTYIDRYGVLRPSPLLAEVRQSTAIMCRALGMIQMTDTPKADPVKQRAGRASWAARSGSK
jgi:hypothetical protein